METVSKSIYNTRIEIDEIKKKRIANTSRMLRILEELKEMNVRIDSIKNSNIDADKKYRGSF